MKRSLYKLLILVLTLWMYPVMAHPQGKTYSKTWRILANLGDAKLDCENYAKAFRLGFDRVNDLVHALDDEDAMVRLKAQVVLRYIADPAGLAALDRRLLKRGDLQTTGPVPTPVAELDYALFTNLYLSGNSNRWRLYETRIALVIDGSARARAMLDELRAKGLNPDEDTLVVAREPFDGGGGVEQAALRNSFFIPERDRRLVTAKLLALSPSKDRALVSLYVNRGVLAEEWWHVVVSKHGNHWRFVSITLVGNS